MTRKSYDAEDAASLAALGRAVLQVIDGLPSYPVDPQTLPSVADDLCFAVRLTDSLANKLNKAEADQDLASQLLIDRQWRFFEPNNVDPASLDSDEVFF